MNSKLLEEAIIDAEALREAALKNAEQAILEKYAPEVKSAIENLLEQEEMDMGMDMGMEEPQKEMDVPLAATDGEKLCPCPDEDEVVTISIADLEDAIKKTVADTARASAGPTPEEPEMDMGMDMGMEEPGQEELPPPEEEELPEEPMLEELEIDEELIASILSEKEELEEEAALEEQKPDFLDLDKDGDKKEPKKTDAIQPDKQTLEETKKHDSKMLVENKKVLNENKLLTEKLSKLLEQHEQLEKQNHHFKETILKVSQRLEESNLMNAKLFYKNQALGSDSLNERQKNKIVEAVSKAGSVDEAKMIYETLCNAVGNFDNKGPQSLSEAVEQKGGMVIKPRQQTNSNPSPLKNRWQKIAGIKK